MSKKQQGFSIIEIILVIAIVVIIGAVGWYAWKQHHKKADTSSTPTSSTSSTPASSAQETKNALGLTQTDKNAIVASVLAYCKRQSPQYTYSINLSENLDNTSKTKVADNFVFTALYCHNDNLAADQQGSSAQYIVKKEGSTWTTISGDQMPPGCDKVDGKGIPASLGVQCYDTDNQLRAVKA